MPLSPPVARQPLHTRRVVCQGYFREDGLWDIEGRITDEKSYEHANEWRGPLAPGDFVHDMSIRLTLDHKFTIVDVEAVTDKSPYRICGDIAPDFKKLIGLRIAGGFHREVRARLGGVHGCTHIVELLGPVATTAFQTVSSRKASELNRAYREKSGTLPPIADADAASAKPRRKPYMIDNCHAWASDSEVVKRWVPDFYSGPDAEAVRAAAAGKTIEMEG
jgi:cation diffusion facilitator CzcD-associated flavoprotein CzcO